MGTKFSSVYNRFLGKVTDDMYVELTPEDTMRDMQNLLIDALPGFEFPRKNLNYTISVIEGEEGDFVFKSVEGISYVDNSAFEVELDSEEINIIAILMMCSWVQRQVTSIELTRQKYGGTEFKMTSQANHLARLLTLLKECQRQSLHMQRLYKRRKTDKVGLIKSDWSVLREKKVY